MDETDLVTGGGGGILGTILAWLGFKGKLSDMDKRIDKINETMQFKEVCNTTHEALCREISEMKKDLKEDIGELKDLMIRNGRK